MSSTLLTKLIHRQNLSKTEAITILQNILNNAWTPVQVSGVLTALGTKGETIEEITGFASVMRDKCVKIKANSPKVLDTCGTGGDCTGSFNISTATAIVTSACGLTVAKHGNKAVTSQTGSSQVLEELGININLPPTLVENCLNEIKLAFLFAPLFHPAMKYVAPIRAELGVQTVFNILGPLTNPAQAKYQLMGVFDPNLTEVMAQVLGNLGSTHVLVVHGEDGMDEISLTSRTKISEYQNGKVKTYYIEPEQFDLKKARIEDLKGGSASENAQIIENILNGQAGPKKDIVLLNSAAALVASEEVNSFTEGIKKADHAISSGKAKKKLEELVNWTNRMKFNSTIDNSLC